MNLYSNPLIEHSRRPQNFRKIEDASLSQTKCNSLCGDEVTIFVKLATSQHCGAWELTFLSDISFTGQSCSVATACASLMTEALVGLSCASAIRKAEHLKQVVQGLATDSSLGTRGLEDFAQIAEGLKGFPGRLSCSLLGVDAFLDCLEGVSNGG
ncbi:hypothetical protein CMI37_32040 [Candidatus Pacearchaeota archaeon]|nr:hypothetical protein [Candidatus Pacearchaeota archaeon]|tara:strand:+ start:87 stop:551 length:465 start_codon:yes stop_codon:yes gene_type:complete